MTGFTCDSCHGWRLSYWCSVCVADAAQTEHQYLQSLSAGRIDDPVSMLHELLSSPPDKGKGRNALRGIIKLLKNLSEKRVQAIVFAG